jgi:hypothetical protein
MWIISQIGCKNMTRTQQNYKVAKFFLNRYSTAFQRFLKRIEDFNKIVVAHLLLKNFDVEITYVMENS